MRPGIAEPDKPAEMDDTLEWAARGCYHACQDCGAWQIYEKIGQCTDCGIEKARQFVKAEQQKILNRGERGA